MPWISYRKTMLNKTLKGAQSSHGGKVQAPGRLSYRRENPVQSGCRKKLFLQLQWPFGPFKLYLHSKQGTQHRCRTGFSEIVGGRQLFTSLLFSQVRHPGSVGTRHAHLKPQRRKMVAGISSSCWWEDPVRFLMIKATLQGKIPDNITFCEQLLNDYSEGEHPPCSFLC